MSSSDNLIHLDAILTKFKIFGRYNLQTILLIFIANATNSIYCHNYVFTIPNVEYRCKDERFVNNTCGALEETGEYCTEWVYEDANTFVAEFQLACQDWKRTLVGTIHSFGYMIGLLLVGPLSDRIGRKKMIVLTGVLGAAFGLSRSFVSSYWLYIILEFLEASIGDTSSPTFMLTIEIAAKEKRVGNQLFCRNGFMSGAILLALTAWQIPYFRSLLQVIYGPAFLFFLYIFLLDESPRWLLSKGRKDEAIVILKKAAKKDKIDLDQKALNSIIYQEEQGIKFVELLKKTISSKTILIRFLICLVWWIVGTFLVFGINVNVVFLPGSKYINYAIMSLMCVPGTIILFYTMNRFSRKTVLSVSFLLCSVFMTIQPFIPTTLLWPSILIYMIGEMLNGMCFQVTYLFTSEIFPTYTRNCMHALCSSLGRIGSTIAPQTPLLIKYWYGLPSLVFGMAALFAGLVTLLFAPDGTQDSLPDNVTQAEALGTKTKANFKVTQF